MAHAYVPYHNAGAETTMHAELRHLVKRGHKVDVLLSRSREDITDRLNGPPAECTYEVDGVTVHPHRSNGDPFRWFGTADNRPDIVIAHLENTLRAAALCDIHQIPMVHLIHNTHEFNKGALRRGPSQLAVFNTYWMLRDYKTYFGFHGLPMPPHTVVLPPVNYAEYAGEPGDHITLINLNEAKGGEVFWALAARHPRAKFLAVKGAYGEQIVPDEIPANVEVLEHMAPARMREAVYARTKVLLMPSSYESYGRTGVEAACSGIPTVAHPTPGLREALGDAGYFADRDDLDAWSRAIGQLVDPRTYPGASAAARAHAQALTPDADLDRFCDEMERTVRRGFATLAR